MFSFAIDADHLAWLTFDLPGEKVNKFTPEALQKLSEILDGLAENREIKALVITSGKKDCFIAGADIKMIQSGLQNSDLTQIKGFIELGHSTFNKIQQLPYPTFALIDGACLGGGMELALACSYRYISDNPKTTLGLPETSLGIFPGWGGTQRMPRLVGLAAGLELILTGRPIKAMKAWKMGLADGIGAAEFFDAKSREFIRTALTEKGRENLAKRRRHNDLKTLLLEKNPLGRKLLFWQARRSLLSKTKGHYPAPEVALELIEKSCTLPLAEGLKCEIDTFMTKAPELAPVAKNLIQLFFASEALKKFTIGDSKPKEIRSTAVLRRRHDGRHDRLAAQQQRLRRAPQRYQLGYACQRLCHRQHPLQQDGEGEKA